MKTRKNISIEEDTARIIDQLIDNGFNFSAWVEEQVQKNFSTIDLLKIKRESLKHAYDDVCKHIGLLEELENKKLLEIQNKEQALLEEIVFWREANNNLKRNINFLDGLVSRYNNEYGKKVDKIEFLGILKFLKEAKHIDS